LVGELPLLADIRRSSLLETLKIQMAGSDSRPVIFIKKATNHPLARTAARVLRAVLAIVPALA
jgi:hypothetical protein